MKKESIRKSLAWLLVLVMALSTVPLGALAEGEVPQEIGTVQEIPEIPETPETPESPETPKTSETQKSSAKSSETPKTSETPETPKTPEAPEGEAAQNPGKKTDAPVGPEGEKRTTEEEQTPETPEEEAARKAAEAQRASDEAVRNVQEKINALPPAESITADNRGEVEETLNAIDDAKGELTDEEREKLDFTRYDAAAEALNALDGMPGAGVPVTLAGSYPTVEELKTSLKVVYDGKSTPLTKLTGSDTILGAILTGVTEFIELYFEASDRYWGLDCDNGLYLEPQNQPAFWKVSSRNSSGVLGVSVEIHEYNDTDGTGMKVNFYGAYTVSFNSNGGSKVDSQYTDEQGKLSDLPTPTREGCTFGGWYLNEQCTGERVDENYIYSDDTTLYAKWNITARVSVMLDNEEVDPENWYVELTLEDGPMEKIDGADSLTITKPSGSYTLKVCVRDGENTYSVEESWNSDATYLEDLYSGKFFSIRLEEYGADLFKNAGIENETQIKNAVAAKLGYKERAISIDINIANRGSNVYSIYIPIYQQEELKYYSGIPLTIRLPGKAEGKCFTITYKDGSELNAGESYEIQENDLVLKNFEEKEYKITSYDAVTITYDGNGGTVDGSTSEQVGKDCEYTISKTATRTGYTFLGWATTPDATTGMTTITPTGNTTLYAVWNPINITLTGDGITEKTVHPNTEGRLDEQWFKLTRKGYVFRGWAEDGIRIDKNRVFENNATLTACWNKVDTAGCVLELAPLTMEQAEAIFGDRYDPEDVLKITASEKDITDALKEAAKNALNTENYRTKCYDVTVSIQMGGEMARIEDTGKTLLMTLPGSWADFGDKLQILRTHGGETGPLERKTSAELADGTTEGWYLEGGKLYLAGKLFSDYAVAYVAPTVTFDSQGGTACTPAQTGTDGKLTILPVPTRTGYTFDGWYLTEDCTGTKLDESHVYTADTTVYAKWTAGSYTVTFHSNYGDTDTTATQDFTYDVPQALNCGSGITRNYYKISGWAESADGEKKYEANETVKNLGTQSKEGFLGKDLYALWEYVPYTVTFDAQGVNEDGQATNGTVTENGQKKPTVERKTQENPVNTLKTLPVPDAQENYYFEGWYYKDRADKEQPVEIGKTVFSADTRVYAKWKTFEPVTVTLKCQRGTMTLGGKTVSEGTMQTKWPGVVDGTLPTPGRTGYKFQGWYTAAGVKVDQDTIYLRDTTIYARWTSAVSRTGNPKTGDRVMLGLAGAVLVLAPLGLAVAVIINKKNKK